MGGDAGVDDDDNKAAGSGAPASPTVTRPPSTATTTKAKAAAEENLHPRHRHRQRRGLLLLSNPLLLRWSSRRNNNSGNNSNSNSKKRYPSGRIDKEDDSICLLDGPLGCCQYEADMVMNDVTASSSFSLSSSYSDAVLNPGVQKTIHPREWTTGRRCESGAHGSSGFGGCGASRPSTLAAATTTTTNRGSSRAVVSGAAPPHLATSAELPEGHIPVLLLPSTTNLLVLPRNPSSSESHVSDLGFYDPAEQVRTPMPTMAGGGGRDSQGAATKKKKAAAAPGGRAATHHHGNNPRHNHRHGSSSRQQHQDSGPIVSIRSVDEFLFGGGGGGSSSNNRDKEECGEDKSFGIGPVLVSTVLPVNDVNVDDDDDDDWEMELSQRSVNSDHTATTRNGGVDVGRMHALLLLQHSNKTKKTSAAAAAAANALYMNRSKILSRSGSAKSSGQKQQPPQKSSFRSLRSLEVAASGGGTGPSPSSTSWWKRDIELRPDPSSGRASLRPSFLPAAASADSEASSNRHRTSAALSAPSARLLIKVQADSWRQAVESLQALSVEDWSALGMTDDDDDDGSGSSDGRRLEQDSFTVDDEDLQEEQHQGRTGTHGGVAPRCSRPVSLLGAGLYDDEEESFAEPGARKTPAPDSYNANCQRQQSTQNGHRRRNHEPSAAIASGPSPSSKKTGRDRVRISHGASPPMSKHKKAAVGRGNASSVLDVLGRDSFLNSARLVPDRRIADEPEA
jgi:hypothetical protein